MTLYFQLEWKKLQNNKAVPIALLCFFGLMLYGLHNGRAHQESIKQEQARLRAEEIQNERSLLASYDGPLTPYEVGGRGARRYIFKAPAPLAMIAEGESRLFPSAYSISLRDEDFTILSEGGHLDNPLNLAIGTFDLAFVLVWLLPLLAILYTYNLLSEEEEMGTLPLLMAQPASVMSMLWAKTIARYLLLTIPVLTLSLLAMGLMGLDILKQAGQLALLLGAISAYLLFWFFLALLANLLRLSSLFNLSLLFGGWLLFVLAIPTALSIRADYRHSVPSRIQLVNDIRSATREIDNDASRLLDAYYYDHPELAPEDDKPSMASYVYKNALKHKMVEAAARPAALAYREQSARQQAYVYQRKFYSPALLLQSAFSQLAGNTLGDFLAFQARADLARRQWWDIFEPKIFKDEWMNKAEIERLPDFAFAPEYGSSGKLWLSLAGLLAFALACGALAACTGFRARP